MKKTLLSLCILGGLQFSWAQETALPKHIQTGPVADSKEIVKLPDLKQQVLPILNREPFMMPAAKTGDFTPTAVNPDEYKIKESRFETTWVNYGRMVDEEITDAGELNWNYMFPDTNIYMESGGTLFRPQYNQLGVYLDPAHFSPNPFISEEEEYVVDAMKIHYNYVRNENYAQYSYTDENVDLFFSGTYDMTLDSLLRDTMIVKTRIHDTITYNFVLRDTVVVDTITPDSTISVDIVLSEDVDKSYEESTTESQIIEYMTSFTVTTSAQLHDSTFTEEVSINDTILRFRVGADTTFTHSLDWMKSIQDTFTVDTIITDTLGADTIYIEKEVSVDCIVDSTFMDTVYLEQQITGTYPVTVGYEKSVYLESEEFNYEIVDTLRMYFLTDPRNAEWNGQEYDLTVGFKTTDGDSLAFPLIYYYYVPDPNDTAEIIEFGLHPISVEWTSDLLLGIDDSVSADTGNMTIPLGTVDNEGNFTPGIEMGPDEMFGVVLEYIPGYDYTDNDTLWNKNYFFLQSMNENVDGPQRFFGDYNSSHQTYFPFVYNHTDGKAGIYDRPYMTPSLNLINFPYQHHQIDFRFIDPTSTADVERSGLKVGAYPNPADDEIVFSLSLYEREEVVINLYDLTGKLVKSVNYGVQPQGELTNYRMDLSKLNAGIYMYDVNGSTAGKLIVR